MTATFLGHLPCVGQPAKYLIRVLIYHGSPCPATSLLEFRWLEAQAPSKRGAW